MKHPEHAQDLQPVAPVFIGGLYKSGTSLLRAMLGQHKDLTTGLETYWFELDWLKKDRKFFNRIDLLGKFYDIAPDRIQHMVKESTHVGEFLNRLLSFPQPQKRWVEKTPGNIKHMDQIFQYWPEAQVVHIVRDPRDVLASLRQAKKWDSVDEFVSIWCEFFTAAEQHRQQLSLNDEQYQEVRYEALVVEPHKTMRSILEFLGEPWDEAVATFAGSSEDFNKVLTFTGKVSTTLDRLRSPLMGTRIGIWKTVLKGQEIELIEERVRRKGMLAQMRELQFEE